MERLDKLISSQCELSRKEIHKLIWTGHVSVNDKVETKIDRKTDGQKDIIKIDGNILSYKKYVYIMLNKPEGCVSASSDKNAKTVIDLLPSQLKRKGLAPVGRLDKDTTGLLIITDDGNFSHRVTSPGKKIFKTYKAMLDGILSREDEEKIRSGIVIDGDERCKPAFVSLADEEKLMYEIRICEGKYHQVKRMFAAVGKHVLKLERSAIGALTLDAELTRGEARELSPEELDAVFILPEK